MKFLNIILILGMGVSLNAGDIMVERMQSVVSEVSELRKRYEDAVKKNERCLSQLNGNVKLEEKTDASVDQTRMKALIFENSKLKEAHETAKVQNIERLRLKDELEASRSEQKRLNDSALILVEKNHSLLAQLTKLKQANYEVTVDELTTSKSQLEKKLDVSRSETEKLQKENISLREKLLTMQKNDQEKNVLKLKEDNRGLRQEVEAKTLLIKALKETASKRSHVPVEPINTKAYESLQKENISLHKALKSCAAVQVKRKNIIQEPSKKICVDDNPFPKLMPKQKKDNSKPVKKEKVSKTSTKLSGVFRIKGESPIYNGLDGDVIEIWEDTRSFTSNVYKDDWVKITGYFVDRKWQKAANELWVKRENTLSR